MSSLSRRRFKFTIRELMMLNSSLKIRYTSEFAVTRPARPKLWFGHTAKKATWAQTFQSEIMPF